MAQRIQVGVIGTSWWVDLEHLPGLRARGDAEVVALCGRDPAKLGALAAKFGVPRTYTDWRALLAHPGLQAVVIATPNVLHAEQAAAAIDAGLHVICEKPLAVRAADALALAARAEAAGRAGMTFFTHRTVGAASQVKQLVQQGFLGRPLHASAQYLTSSQLKPGKAYSWKMSRAEAGSGTLGDIGSHVVDLVRWFLADEYEAVVGQWQTLPVERAGGTPDADDACAFLARMRSGVQVVVQATKLAPGLANFQRVELHGTDGTLVYEADPGADPTWEGRVLAGKGTSGGLLPIPLVGELAAGLRNVPEPEGRAEAYRRLTDPFFAAVAGKLPIPAVTPSLRDGAAVQAVLDAVGRSIERGAWEKVQE